ncbi:MAG TPA: Ku protein [Candidatus Binatia bacterium]|nr:Ku protein [Candidatus Binatia bacterium]
MPRAIASATISFGLVTIPVNVYPVTEAGAEIRFHWLHAKCGTRLKQQYYCPKDDEVVSRKDMIKGYELGKGRFVTFTAEELKALEEQATQTIEVSEFLPIDEVDPVYFDRTYHLGPAKNGQRAFAVLGKAMAQSDRAALGSYAARGKQYLVLLRPFGNALVLHQLHYAEEIRSPVASFDGKVKEGELKLARQLIDQISTERFKPEAYRDEVRERVRAQIKRKADGKEIAAPAAQRREGKVLDLMEALKASLATREPRRGGGRKPAKRAARSTSRRRGARRSSAA